MLSSILQCAPVVALLGGYLVSADVIVSNATIFTDTSQASFNSNSDIHQNATRGPGYIDPLTQGAPLEAVHYYETYWPTGIAVSNTSRKFSNFPRSDTKNIPYTVAELINGKEVPYPSKAYNLPPGGAINYTVTPPLGANYVNYLVSVQSVVIDPANRLWILDTGRPTDPKTNMMVSSAYGGPKLVGVDLSTNKIFKTIVFPQTVAYPDSYLNDIRFDLRPSCSTSGKGIAYISDSSNEGRNGIIIVDLGTGKAWRKLENVPEVRPENRFVSFVCGDPWLNNPGKGQPVSFTSTGIDGIALSADGETFYFTPNSGRILYSVPTALLRSQTAISDLQAAASISNYGEKGQSDGMETDSNNIVYFGVNEANGIYTYDPQAMSLGLLTRDPRICWSDTLAVSFDGYLYFTVNQYHLAPVWQGGIDKRKTPYVLYRVPTVGMSKKIILK